MPRSRSHGVYLCMSVLIFGSDASARALAGERLSDAGVTAEVSEAGSVAQLLDEVTIASVESGHGPKMVLLLASIQFAPQSQAESASGIALADAELLAARWPLVCITQQAFDSQQWLALLRAGVRDVQPTVSAAKTAELLQRLAQHNSAQASVSAEAQYLSELQRDQRAGRQVQLGMLPPSPMAIDQYRLSHQIWPSLMLSGDFVDYFEISDGYFAFYVADVAGHGASSAFVTVLLKNFSRRLRREYRSSMLEQPGEVLSWLNSELLDNGIDKHVAIVFGMVNRASNELKLANAGHFPPAIVVRRGKAEFVEQASKPAGIFPNVDYSSKSIELSAGDRLMVVSDGVFEQQAAQGAARDLTNQEQRILQAAQQCGGNRDAFWKIIGCDPANASSDDITWFQLSREA